MIKKLAACILCLSLLFFNVMDFTRNHHSHRYLSPPSKVHSFEVALEIYVQEIKEIYAEINPLLERYQLIRDEQFGKWHIEQTNPRQITYSDEEILLILRLRELFRKLHNLEIQYVLSPREKAEGIFIFIQQHLNNPEVLNIQVLSRLFPIIIRELKKMGSNWTTDLEWPLAKNHIFNYLFQHFHDWKNLSSIGSNEKERKSNVEMISTLILIHLLGVKGILFFEEKDQKFFKELSSIGQPQGVPINDEEGYAMKAFLGPGMDLIGADLRGVKLNRSRLGVMSMELADLRGANLEYSDLARCRLNGALIQGANLRVVYARLAHLIGANLNGTLLEGAILNNARLQYASLKGANLGETQIFYYELDSRMKQLIFRAHVDAMEKRGIIVELQLEPIFFEQSALLFGTNLAGADLDGVKGLEFVFSVGQDDKFKILTTITEDQRRFFRKDIPSDSFHVIKDFPKLKPTSININISI